MHGSRPLHRRAKTAATQTKPMSGRRHLGIVLLAGCCFGPTIAQAQLRCLPIAQIHLRDASHLSAREVQVITAPYEGKCLGLPEFDAILEAVTLTYVDQGYILARAYLPEQDLSDGSLDIQVIEGQVADIRMNGAQHPLWAAQVFPGVEGKIAHIRTIEQGLDQIETMPRWSAQMEFTPGDAPGDSILEVAAKTDKPVELRLSTHNRGIKPTGEWVTTATLDWTHMLGISDSWYASATKSLPGPLALGSDGGSSTSYGFGGKIPYGKWTFSYDHSRSSYGQTIPGAVSPIAIDGKSLSHSVRATYLLHRDQTTKTTAEASLTHASSQNYIEGILIGNSSRSLTWGRIGVAHERPLWGGQLSGEAHLELGLPWFGAERTSDRPEGSPEAQYVLVGGSATWERAFESDAGRFDVTSTGKFQLSGDSLYGGQQFSVGGASTVRGTRIALASGSSGLFWRGEVEWHPAALTGTSLTGLRPYGAVDWGHVLAQDEINARRGSALAGVVGLKYDRERVSFDLSYQEVLTVSERLQRPEGELFLTAEVRF